MNNSETKAQEYFRVAEAILQKYHFIEYNNKYYIFTGKIYECIEGDTRILKRIINKEYNNCYGINQKKEIIDFILTEGSFEKKEPTPFIITFQNGILNVKTKEFKEHSPEIIAFNIIPHNYNPNAEKDENVEKFLKDFTCDNTERTNCLLEFISFAMLPQKSVQKALFLYGELGENGKTTFRDFFINILGKENTKEFKMDWLDSEKFSSANSENMLLCYDGDVPEKMPNDVPNFKKLIADKYLTVRPMHQKEIDIHSYCTLLSIMNNVPKSLLGNNPKERRAHFIKCLFSPTAEQKASFDFSKLVTEHAMEHLINVSVNAYYRWRERGGTDNVLSNTEESNKIIAEQKQENNYLLTEFLNDDIVQKAFKNNKIKGFELYKLYRKWAEDNKIPEKEIMNTTPFYNAIRKTGLFKETKAQGQITFERK